MNNAYLFLKNKIQKQVSWKGEDFVFVHVEEDKYHEAEETVEITVKGVYHQSTSYEQKTTTNGSVTASKPSPMILCLYEDANTITVGDTVTINDKDMIVTGIENVQELNVALQISLGVNE